MRSGRQMAEELPGAVEFGWGSNSSARRTARQTRRQNVALEGNGTRTIRHAARKVNRKPVFMLPVGRSALNRVVQNAQNNAANQTVGRWRRTCVNQWGERNLRVKVVQTRGPGSVGKDAGIKWVSGTEPNRVGTGVAGGGGAVTRQCVRC